MKLTSQEIDDIIYLLEDGARSYSTAEYEYNGYHAARKLSEERDAETDVLIKKLEEIKHELMAGEARTTQD